MIIGIPRGPLQKDIKPKFWNKYECVLSYYNQIVFFLIRDRPTKFEIKKLMPFFSGECLILNYMSHGIFIIKILKYDVIFTFSEDKY